jgi:hypothetical protein
MLHQKFIYKPSGRLCQIINVGYSEEPIERTITLKGLTTGISVELHISDVLYRIRIGQLIPVTNDMITKWIPNFSFV